MRFRVSIGLMAIAIAMPAFGQHGARGGFSGHSGVSGHAGFAGHPGFSGSSGFSRSAPYMGNGGLMRPGFARFAPQTSSGFRIPYQGRGGAQSRPSYRPGYGGNYGWNRGRYRSWAYGYGYPGYLGYPYPYVIDPGFYDWGDSSGSDDNAQGSPSGYPDAIPYADYGAPPDAPPYAYDGAGPGGGPEPAYGQMPPATAPMPRQPYAGSISSAPEVQQPLTVIFKNGRAPQTMQNYMMNSSTLTDLDQQHYEQIPLDQIDMAATEQTNRTRGVDFQAPVPSHE